MAESNIDPNAIADRIKSEVPKPEDDFQAEDVTAEADVPQESVPSGEESAPMETAPTEEPAPEPSRRDTFRKGISERNSDLDMEDDDAYYDYLDSQLSERDGYEKAVNNLRSTIDNSPEFAEMLTEAAEQENYSPIHYLLTKVRQGEIDLDELANNPDYADKYAEAQAEYYKKKETQKRISEEGEKNFNDSMNTILEVQKEKGLSDEEINSVMDEIYQISDDLAVNKLSKDTFIKLLNALRYDTDVEDARRAGKAEGLNTKIKETVRKPVAPNRAGGSQTPMAEPKPQSTNNQANMFGL